ncbi:AAA family ATPase [Streptomyces tubercidicus]|uniref:Endonuclease GajA/Old nuclease/RecF-like AAA domain-containing protein n=1 Tax=Streptomyces tubercidicus TaxID=47759 RepID=A0A640V0Q6_9ACTN|nr:AAA family ATPase [Streptomyces tubercidicus]WAU16140.1 ATP-binding protein [Streptomyces tubercidicus]GFE42068.1 hypothetical protein Stube_67410 [Streptomyces tubercidicus]
MRPRLAKAVIRNFRLLRRTDLSFADKVTLCVGRNNTGKTSLAKLFAFFVARKKTTMNIEDFSADCYEEFSPLIASSSRARRSRRVTRFRQSPSPFTSPTTRTAASTDP